MQCPYCGRENPEHPRPCTLCGYDPTVPYEPPPQRTSTAAIASLVLAVLSFLTFLITALPAIVLACTALIQIRRSRGRLKGKRLAVAGIIVSIAALPVLYSLWRLDAPPIPNDYTIADLRSAPPEYAKSFDLLKSLEDKERRLPDAPAIGLSQEDIQILEEMSWLFEDANHAEIAGALRDRAPAIKQAWQNARKGRDIISRLNTFGQIADQTEPDWHAGLRPFGNIRRMTLLYRCYASLQADEHNHQIAVNELIELDSVFRKLSVNARPIITKLICWAYMGTGIETADYIANSPNISKQSLTLLGEHFTPLTDEELSLRSVFISEYLMFRKTLDTRFQEMTETSCFFLKRNSTLRLYRDYCDRALCRARETTKDMTQRFSAWPTLYPDCMPKVRLYDDVMVMPRDSWLYKCYNPGGCLFMSIIAPPFRTTIKTTIKTKAKVQIPYDLLQIVLNKRLGRPVNLKARAYSDEYIIDVEGKKIFSPGPDGEIDTRDDIKLPINPDVLGWTK